MNFHNWLLRRECGLCSHVGDRDYIMRSVYKSIENYSDWSDPSSDVGAIFNVEFSPEGNVLVAACEKKSILVFDAITTKQTKKISNAHTDNVNCVKFLDDRMFATCSDDATVALWDLRYLKMKLRSLNGHSNWVKNIEYSKPLLVTSGFDGSIFTWDINSHTEQGLIYQKVFNTSGLMRCRIAPDGTKLVICTTGGYLMIIHHLDLTTLHKDLCGFRPSIYRLMQMGEQYIPQAAKFDHVFSKRQKKNRVELVTDFPEENDAEVVLALQIHPQGHCILSRNISYDELTEFTCVHDINEEPSDITERMKEPSAKRRRRSRSKSDDEQESSSTDNESSSGDGSENFLFSINRRNRYNYRTRSSSQRMEETTPPPPPPPIARTGNRSSPNTNNAANGSGNGNGRQDTFIPDIWAAEVTVRERAIRQSRVRNSNSVTGYNFVYAISSGVLPAAPTVQVGNLYIPRLRIPSASGGSPRTSRNSTLTPVRSSTPINTRTSYMPATQRALDRLRSYSPISLVPPANIKPENKIFQNPKKLMYYVKESNKDRGFIKEPCFSADGRIISSPYINGVRLLGYNSEFTEYPHDQLLEQEKRNPKPLTELKRISNHKNFVLCTRFSPREPLLVTGCQGGNVAWHHPNL